MGRRPLWGRCPLTPTYTHIGATGTADHLTLLRLFQVGYALLKIARPWATCPRTPTTIHRRIDGKIITKTQTTFVSTVATVVVIMTWNFLSWTNTFLLQMVGPCLATCRIAISPSALKKSFNRYGQSSPRTKDAISLRMQMLDMLWK